MRAEPEQTIETDTEHKKVPQLLFALLAAVLACVMYYAFVVHTARVTVEIEVDETSRFGIYWAEGNKGYSEKNLATVLAHPDRSEYSFYLTNLGKLSRLRIDPHCYTGAVTLKRLEIHQEGYEPIVLASEEDFQQLVPLQQIAETRVDSKGLWIRSTGEDPNLELLIAPEKTGFNFIWLLVRFLAIGGVVFTVIYALLPFIDDLKIVPVLLFGAWILVIIMAGISKQNVHPDEYVHIAATAYYADHWLPPVVDDPAIEDTYSVYGASRLNAGEMYYLLAGKTYKILQFFQMPETFGYRFFNVALFGVIFLISTRSVYARIAALPYLISSQVWYIFAYCGSDAFALFIAFFATYVLIDPNSLLHRYLRGGGAWFNLFAALTIAPLLGALFILKMNFYPFVGLIYLVLVVRIFFAEEYYWDKKGTFTRLVLVTLLGLSFLGIRSIADYTVNGLDRGEKIAAMKEELGQYRYKKSTPVEERVPTLYMKDRGVTFTELIPRYHWDIKTFQSSFGVFGYLSIVSPSHYYTVVAWMGTALLLFILISSLSRGGIAGGGVTVVVCGLSGLLVLAALYHCWVVDFQPQGRYLFPIVPMFGVVLGHNMKAVNRRILLLLVGVMFVLGLYSYIFQGLLRITRLSY